MNFPHKDFEKASCKDANIDKGLLVDMFDKIDEEKINIHSMILIKDGNKVFDAYASGYGPDFKEEVYSISKSFTSLAIGICQDMGLLNIHDKIIQYFEGHFKKIKPYYDTMTIQNLLTMTVGHPQDYLYSLKPNEDPINAFFQGDITDAPGTKFMYNTLASFILSVIVTKVTGKTVNDFLDEKLYQPLQIEKPLWHTIGAYSAGGYGLELSILDLAKFGHLLLNDGNWRGQQIVSKAYIREATSFQISTAHVDNPADRYGYGYQFWINEFGDFRAAGLFKQYIVINREFNVVFCTQAYEERELLNLYKSYVLTGLHSGWTFDNFTLRNYIRRFGENSLEVIKNEKLNRKM